MKRKMRVNNSEDNAEDGGADEVQTKISASENSANEGEDEHGAGEQETTADDQSYEEECVICLEPLSAEPWGRCTPCQHPFHKKCWFQWENSHNQRVDQRRQRGQSVDDNEGPKCCLCNTVNKQFVDGTGEPAHNPSPYVASEDTGAGGNRFSNFFREAAEEASGFMEFLQSEFRETVGRAQQQQPPSFPFGRSRTSTTRSSSNASSTDRRRSETAGRFGAAMPPFFGMGGSTRSSPSRSSSSASPNNRTNGSSFFGGGSDVPPFSFRNRASPTSNSSQQTAWSRNTTNSNGNPFNIMRRGTQVTTQNLVNSPHLNGQAGSIVQYQPSTQRYQVQLEASVTKFMNHNMQGPVAIKPENLLQTPKIKIHGLQSQPNLNGKEGTIIGYSRQRDRYVVEVDYLLSPSREISIKPTNIRIPSGTCVRLEGLQRTPQWNGKYGTIVGWVEDGSGTSGSGRYEVCLSRQYAVRVRMENVRL